jgi:hypothetical protein
MGGSSLAFVNAMGVHTDRNVSISWAQNLEPDKNGVKRAGRRAKIM